MRRATAILFTLLTLTVLAGCGGGDSASDDTQTSTTAAAASPAPATTSTPAATTAAADGGESPFIVVTSLLGKPLPKEPGCRFARTFVPDNPSAGSYDGALTLLVTCAKADGFEPTGQIVNRAGSKPTEITCRQTRPPELYCIYVPSSSVGLYFTGTDRAVVRRRLERLIEVVRPLPTGVTPLSGTSAP